MTYIFDETDPFFRSPTGAIKTPGRLGLRIKLRRGKATAVKVRMYPDGGEASDTAMLFDHVTGAFDVYKAKLDVDAAGLYWYHFIIEMSDGTVSKAPEHEGGSFQITAYPQPPAHPDWIYGGLIYHIFVDRFCRGERQGPDGEAYPLRPGAVFRHDWGGCPRFRPDEEGIVRNNDFFGGDLYGIMEKLPYLEKLGVTCIYLSPVFEAASNHKYDTGDYMKIDPSFGGDEAFADLCREAGARGITLMLDGVFNHVGIDSRYFNRYGTYDSPGAYGNHDSPYRNWFHFRDDGSYESWWNIELLPALNKSNPGYRELICGEDGVIANWTRKGVSAWRLDVVDELPDSFLDCLCQAVRREKSDALIVGEVWEDASHKIAYSVRRRYFNGGQLDSVTNYPLKNAIISCVLDGNVTYLAETMSSLCKNYPENVLNSLMNIVGTHDTMRILTVLSGADLPHDREAMSVFSLSEEQRAKAKRLLKLASALQFTLPGVPCVYYGDEAGMEGGADPFNRGCYPWGHEDTDLLDWYCGLSRLRKAHYCFKDGSYELVEARDGLFAFTRGEGYGLVLVAVNTSDTNRILGECGLNYDLLNGEYTDELVVNAGQAAIFTMKGDIPVR